MARASRVPSLVSQLTNGLSVVGGIWEMIASRIQTAVFKNWILKNSYFFRKSGSILSKGILKGTKWLFQNLDISFPRFLILL